MRETNTYKRKLSIQKIGIIGLSLAVAVFISIVVTKYIVYGMILLLCGLGTVKYKGMPLFALYFTVATIVLPRTINYGFMGISITADKAFLIISIVYSVVNFSRRKMEIFDAKEKVIIYGFFLFLFISLTKSLNVKNSISIYLIAYSNLFLFYYFIMKYYKKIGADVLSHILIFSSIIVCIYGIYEYLYNKNFLFEEAYVMQFHWGGINRIMSTFEHPNVFAAYLILAMFVTVSMIVTRQKKSSRIILILVLIMQFINMILTGSRLALGCMGVVLLMEFVISKGKGRKFILYSLCLMFAIYGFYKIGLLNFIVFRFTNEIAQETGDFRVLMWKLGLTMFLKHPFTGIGLGNYAYLSPNYQTQFGFGNLSVYFSSASHNGYINLLAETGIFCFVFFNAFLIKNIIKAMNYINNKEQGLDMKRVKWLLYGFIAYLFNGVGNDIFQWNNLMVCLGIYLALLNMSLVKSD